MPPFRRFWESLSRPRRKSGAGAAEPETEARDRHGAAPPTQADSAAPASRPADHRASFLELGEPLAQRPDSDLTLARDSALMREVVVRDIRGTARDELRRRALAWAQLGCHPHIARCFGAWTEGTVLRVEVERAPGCSLGEWLEQTGVRNAGNALNLAIQIAHALAHAHAAGLAHGAVHPGNVLVDETGFAWLTDFDAALRRAPGTDPARDRYAAPEQWIGEAPNRAIDVFSFGVLLYRLLEGHEPFPVTRGPSRELPPLRSELPDRVRRLLERCLSWDARARPEAAHVVEELCTAYQEHTGVPSPFAALPPLDPEGDAGSDAGACAVAHGDSAAGTRTWELALRRCPGHPEATYNLAVWHWRRAEMTDREVLAWLAPEYPPERWIWRLAACRALVHLERGDLPAAGEALSETRAHAPFGAELTDLIAHEEAVGQAPPLLPLAGNLGALSATVLAPDGSWVAAGGADGTVRVWNTHSGELLQVLEGHEAGINALATDGQGKILVSAADDGTVRVWMLADGTHRVLHTAEPQVFDVALSEDGRLAFSTSGGGVGALAVEHTRLEVWDLIHGRCLRILEGHEAPVKAVALDRHGARAASGDDDRILVWDTRSGEIVHEMRGHTNHVSAVAFAPSGTWLATAAWDQTVRLWHVATGREIRCFTGHEGVVTSVTVSGDRRHLVSCGWDQTVRVWEVSTGRCLRTFDGHRGLVASVSMAREGPLVASAAWDGSLCVWHLAPVAERPGPRLVPRVRHAELSSALGPAEMLRAAERAIAGGHVAAAIDLLHRLQEREHWETAARLEEELNSVCQRRGLRSCRVEEELFAPGVTALAHSAPHGLLLGTRDGAVEPAQGGSPLGRHEGPVTALCVPRQGHYVLSGGADGTVRVWVARGGAAPVVLEGHTAPVAALDVSADGSVVASGSYDHTVRLWRVDEPAPFRVLAGHSRQVVFVRIVADTGTVLSGAYDGTLRLWDAASGRCIRVIACASQPLTSADLLPAGRHAVVGTLDGALSAWDIATGEEVARTEPNGLPVAGIHSADDWVVFVDAGGRIGTWNLQGAPSLLDNAVAEGVVSTVLADNGLSLYVATDTALVRRWRLNWRLSARRRGASLAAHAS